MSRTTGLIGSDSRSLALAAWLLVAVLCGSARAGADRGAPGADEQVLKARGAELLAPFKRDLKAALKSGLRQGPIEAVHVCRVQAPAIAAESSRGAVEVGRSSHRLRNPDNAPAPWMKPVIDAYLAGEPRRPRLVPLDGDRVGYAEPILTEGLCLSCHGEQLDPALRATLAELYPRDEATGFEAGELRGIFWATFPVDED